MAAYRWVYDSRHLQADCQEPGSAPEPYARQIEYGLPLPLPFNAMGLIFSGNDGRHSVQLWWRLRNFCAVTQVLLLNY